MELFSTSNKCIVVTSRIAKTLYRPGRVYFNRRQDSRITIGKECIFLSRPAANPMGGMSMYVYHNN